MDTSPSRRTLLGSAAAATTVTLTGCLGELNALTRGQRRPLSVTVLTSAPDTDPFAAAIARRLSTALEAAGVRTYLHPTSESNLWREVLLNGNFDLYVGRHPIGTDADVLRELFHSRYAEEVGWQNPTGISDPRLDALLERQRWESGSARGETTGAALGRLAELVPIAPLCVPFDLRLRRIDDDLEWGDFGVRNALSYVGLAAPNRHVTVGITSDLDGWNLNPLWVEVRDRATIVDLLYDRLAVAYGDEIHPWLADGWGVVDGDGGGTVLSVRLREGSTWHDGTAITAGDVAFTYRLLADTALGRSEPPVPTVRYRGRSALVRSVEVVDASTVRLAIDASPSVAPLALTVPPLPEHGWRPLGTRGRFSGARVPVTAAITTPNETPVGSGPYRYRQSDATGLVLDRTDHFLDGAPGGFAGEVASADRPERLEFVALASRELAREFLRLGELDSATVPMTPAEFDRARADARVETVDTRSEAVYGIGFNVRRYPMGDPGFRRVVSRLIDRDHAASTVFGRRARPAASIGVPLGDPPARLRWRADDPPIPYLGTDGDIDPSRAREAFREAGYLYSDRDRLLVRR